ncbi:hypothetical protein [Gloeobacter kilaueensis]|uniref:DEP domain-containing protein n=1 Tax=Gloeobacter kilaueensis (strain ATCC BAA-2537 / CCAP 1431/1 / ULC 316 / JS1) TaxID=1183438 RepID=U5QFV2_GLOK1|nr:hypothetical protein [Gloeobacter kilaueensis]AGY57812.1 hypothetical protein GKIL_1566 [Gloeobacter kilaueensis JS1]
MQQSLLTQAKGDPAARIWAAGLDPQKFIDEAYTHLEIRDRWYRFYRFSSCFVGSEAVLWMTRHYGIPRETALMLGNALIEMAVFHHVADDWDFRDDYLFYRFYRDEKHRISAPFTRERALELIGQLGVGQLDAVAVQMYQAMPIQDRRSGLRLHRRSFVGKDAACWFRRRFNLDRSQAIALGNALLSLRVFHHVLDGASFEDGNLLYRFYDDEYRNEVLTPHQAYRKAWQTIQGYGIADLDTFIAQCRRSPSLGLKDRVYGSAHYGDCFAGFDAVSLWSDLLQITRAEAVVLGNYLLDLGRLYHVGDNWGFHDAYLLYRFTTAEQIARIAQPNEETEA